MNKRPRMAELARMADEAGWSPEEFGQAVVAAAGKLLQHTEIVGAPDEIAQWLKGVGEALTALANQGVFIGKGGGRTDA